MGQVQFQTLLGICPSNPCAIPPYFSLSYPKFFRRLVTVLAVCATCNDGMTLRTGTSKNGPAHWKQSGMLYECCTLRVSGGDLRDQNFCYVPNIVIVNSLERVKGIEPSYSAWKAAALPLSYTRAPPFNYHAIPGASTAVAPANSPGSAIGAGWRGHPPLNRRRFHAYTGTSTHNERR